MTLILPKLTYDYDAFVPYIDAETMEIHYTKHHAGYTNNANTVLKGTKWESIAACDILQNLDEIPADIRTTVQNNVGGFCNHAFFWATITPNGKKQPTGELSIAIEKTFGSFESFQEKFAAAASSRFGSGWAWLVLKGGKLSIISTANQDSPLSIGYKRILGLDVWEHAYYLNYQNRRAEYIASYWHIVNWDKANELFNQGGI